MEFPVEFSAVADEINMSKYPKLKAWRDKVKERPAYKKALKANGEYDLKGLF